MISVVLIGILAFGPAARAAIDTSGSFRNDLTIWQYQSPDLGWGNQSAFRLNFKKISSKVKLEGSFDLLVLAGDNAENYVSLHTGQDPSFMWLDTVWVPLFDIRKLYMSLFFDDWTLTYGRQIINYGVGYVFSPVDCFSTVNLQDLSFSRKGSDILRMQAALGDLAGIEGVTTTSADGTDWTGAVKLFGNWRGYDLSLTGIYKKPQEELLVGVTFKGDLKGDLGVGIHGELVEHWNRASDTRFFEAMAGVDYSLNDGKIFLLAEYYYNGNPIDPSTLTPADLLALNRSFLGSGYLFGQVRFVYDEIRSCDLTGIFNPSIGSWVGTFQFLYNIRQNTNLLLHARYYNGDLNGISIPNSPKAEYGAGVEIKF